MAGGIRQTIFLVFAIVAAIAGSWAQPEAGWINVQEMGASGSKFETRAKLTAGSKEIVVADVGDFKVGQGVIISPGHLQITDGTLWGPRSEYGASKPLGELVQVRGYDGSLGPWVVYILDIEGADPPTFRWSDDLGRTWKQEKVKITHDWQPLSSGTEVKFGDLDWGRGYTVTFSVRDQLLTVIEKIEGNKITLRDAPTRSVEGAIMRHNDTVALQAAIDRALREKKNVYFPAGVYRLAYSLVIANASGIVLQGANGEDTVIDISEGRGACFSLREGQEVTLRNFRLIGHSGFEARDQAGYLRLQGAQGVWGFYLKPCNAVNIFNTTRVLVENCHASRMSAECFYSQGRSRAWKKPEPAQYTKQITYLRCSVTDSARNAFNNNDMAENTSVLYCRIVDVGGCSWEGASRFVRFIGNYVRNAGTVAMGNIRSRNEEFEQLGSGQHIVADNVFEGKICYGGAAIRAAAGASQVVIRNNLFINFNSSGIDISGVTGPYDLPAGIATISGNIFDMTDISGESQRRTAVLVTGSHVIVADNQIYTRGPADPQVTAIELREPAINLLVHHNLIRNCGRGLAVTTAQGRVAEVINPTTFTTTGNIPHERRQSHRYRGWGVVFLRAGKQIARGVVESFDPETRQFHLQEPVALRPGDIVEIFPTSGANWRLAHNTIVGCLQPVALEGYGSVASQFVDNIVTGGEARVREALVVKGLYEVTGNHFSGFDEPESVVLSLYPDRFGEPLPLQVRDNIFENCRQPIAESVKSLWEACEASGNLFRQCATVPAQKPSPGQPIIRPVLRKTEAPPPAILPVPRLTKPVKIDGDISEWPWDDKWRIALLEQDPQGQRVGVLQGRFIAARDAQFLYLAVRAALPPNYRLNKGGNAYASDGMEIALTSGDSRLPTPLWVLWGGAGGQFSVVPVSSGEEKERALLTQQTRYAARGGTNEWTAEWRLPLAALGPKAAQLKRLCFNIGLRYQAMDQWVAWRATGAELFHADQAGVLEFR